MKSSGGVSHDVEEGPKSTGTMRQIQKNEKHRKRPRGQKKVALMTSRQSQVMLVLMIFLVVCVLLEITLVDTMFLGGDGKIISTFGAFDPQRVLVSENDAQNDEAKRHLDSSRAYSEKAVVVGLDTCPRYQLALEEEDGPAISVGGLFQKVLVSAESSFLYCRLLKFRLSKHLPLSS